MGNPQQGKFSVEEAAEIFGLLSDKTRLQILSFLSRIQELNGLQLMDSLGMGQSAISHHLQLLRRGNLVKGRRDGHCIFYRLSHPLIKDLLQLILKKE